MEGGGGVKTKEEEGDVRSQATSSSGYVKAIAMQTKTVSLVWCAQRPVTTPSLLGARVEGKET